MNSESLASAWNWAFCEVQSAVDRNCFTLWKKPAHIANLYDWDASSCQADLTAFALTYVMHYLINNQSGLGPSVLVLCEATLIFIAQKHWWFLLCQEEQPENILAFLVPRNVELFIDSS